MTGIRSQPEDTDLGQPARSTPAAADLVSDDDRSIAADSWSIKSEYGSTLDDEQRHADAAEALYVGNFRAASDYRLAWLTYCSLLFGLGEKVREKEWNFCMNTRSSF